MRIAFDKAGMNPLTRLKLIKELGQLRNDIKDPKGSGPTAAMGRIRLLKRLNEIRLSLGADNSDKTTDNRQPDAPSESLELRERPETAGLYEREVRMTKGKRQKANDVAIDLVAKIKAGEVDADQLSEEQRKTLASYTGNGGGLIGADDKKGSAYEYYTPVPIAEGIWQAMEEMGFSGGKVSDPSAGTGIFGATAPRNALVDAVELDETSGTINQILNDGRGYSTTIAPFEQVAAATPDETYDAVVTNVPFGTVADRGGNQLHDQRYQKETLETYFILRSLEKLKPGGLAAFIVPPRCTSGKGGSDRKLRERASYMAEFMGAYRMPNKVFGEAAADTITDVIFFRKHSAEAREKIEEIQQEDAQKLSEYNVLWDAYLDGKYFETPEGRIRVLGEFKAKDPDKFRDVDRVESPQSVPEIAKMIRKLPDSRIDWAALDAVETMPVTYQEGDTVNHGGETLEWRDGKWQALKKRGESETAQRVLGQIANAYTAFLEGVTYDVVAPVIQYLRSASKALDVPGWAMQTVSALERMPEADRADAWLPCVTAAAMVQVLDDNGRDSGVNFRDEYRTLSDAIERYTARGKKLRTKVSGFPKSCLSEMGVHHKARAGFSNVWLGQVTEAAPLEISADAGFEGLKYKAQGHFVSLDDAKALYADGFDPMTSDDWCISADGTQVAKADDYYTGNYGQFLVIIDMQIQDAPEGPIKEKLIRQKAMASERVDRLDPASITHNLFTPYVTIEEKIEFLRAYVHQSAFLDFEGDGDKKVGFDIKSNNNTTDREKLIRRIAHYMNHRTITLGSTKLSMSDEAALSELRAMIAKANEQFGAWAKANRGVQARMAQSMSDPARLYFRQVEDEAPLSVPGLNSSFTPHGYQNAFARAMGRDFSGINGYDTGLGKTFTALLSVQYVQSIGVKKKTAFVVPNSVLSNWRKEVASAYENIDDCLFVGLTEDGEGNFDVKSSKYDEDLFSVLENRHKKIFMTMEAFERLRLKSDTIDDFERYMRSVDASFGESEDKKKDQKAQSKAKDLVRVLNGKSGAAPFLEDMGIDSIVIDEAHAYKNSSETVEFSGAKYLSVSESSKRGMDAQAKCWFIRGLTPRKDGVLDLTATPLTNSPLEMYSMLSMAVGHERVNDMFGGIAGADAFMNAVCDIEDEEDVTLDGEYKSMAVFKGLNNSPMLRRALHQVATIKDADDVGSQIFVPDADEQPTPVTLTDETFARLGKYKDAYRFAMDSLREKPNPGGDPEALEEIMNYFNEPQELIAHPFNLLNKMSYLIADPDMDKRQTRYIVENTEQREQLITAWNAKKHTEERGYIGPNSTNEDIISSKIRKNKAGDEIGKTYKMQVRAWSEGSTICIDTMNVGLQDKFEAVADKLKVDLDVSIPPKLAAMLSNVQKEQASPRGLVGDKKGSYAKQIIFCDLISWHNKIKRLLMKRAGLKASQIAIVTGQKNNEPDEILDVQNEFNAEDGKYRIIIANKKAEVGINLQKGTQAIHHLTIGWTPDSLKQRNGRGVRQGNKTAKVSVYHYDADGTFDEAKRTLVSNKADWINSLMDPDGGERIEISGGMSREKMEALIEVMGEGDGVAKIQAAMEQREAEERAQSSRTKQAVAIDTIEKQNAYLKQFGSLQGWIGRYLGDLLTYEQTINSLRKKIENSKSANRVAMMEMRVSEALASIEGIKRRINEAVTIERADGYTAYSRDKDREPIWKAVDIDEFMEWFERRAGRGEYNAAYLSEGFAGGRLAYTEVRVVEKGESELKEEWASEVDMATELRKQSVDAYEKRAEQDGNTPAGAAAALAEGRGKRYGDTILFDGAVLVPALEGKKKQIVNDKFSALVVDKERVKGFWDGYDFSTGVFPQDRLSNPDVGVVYPGTAEYTDLIAQMAKFEDRRTNKGQAGAVYSELLSEVAALRKTETLVGYEASYVSPYRDAPLLPSPYFPIVINPGEAKNSQFLTSVFEKQKEVVKGWDNSMFSVLNTVEVEMRRITTTEIIGMFKDYAVANGVRLTEADCGPVRYLASGEARKSITEEGVRNAVSGKSTVEEIRESVRQYIRDAAAWFDYGDKWDEALLLTGRIVDKAIEDVTRANEPEQAPEPEKELSDNDLVLVHGDTKQWKEEIKQAGKKYKEQTGHGGKSFAWDKYQGNFAWKIKRGAYRLLIESHPQISNDVAMAEDE